MVFESPAFCKEIGFLAREVEDEETAANMVKLAVYIGETYPCPVVAKTPKGEMIGVRYDKKTGSLITGFGLAVGSREG
jgi:hypothetical protein